MHYVHVVAACTDRKRLPIPARRRLGAVPGRTLAGRFEEWQRRLTTVSSATLNATEMYSGDHWAIARALSQTSGSHGWRVRLWVASAGYGLIPADAVIGPYSATFAPGDPDSVVIPGSTTGREHPRAWWNLLGASPGPTPSAPRRIVDLAATSPRAIVVIASDTYIDAMEDDLTAARAALSDADRLVVVSARPRRATGLEANWVETDARLRQILGGAVGSLNARVARHLLTSLGPAQFTATTARALKDRLLKTAPALPVYDRSPSTDERVASFIRRAIRRDPSACHTPLLRAYRASGHQCEQARFRAIFQRVTREP